jgi:hypothetical protein
MKKFLLLLILLITTAQTILSQTVVLDSNGVTVKWTGTTVPTPYFVQANPRGTGMEWFAIVNNSTKSNITDYAKNIQSGIDYFTRPSTTTPIPFNNIVTTLMTDMSNMFERATSFNQPIGSWNVSNVFNMEGMFHNVRLSTANYDALLIGWSTISPNETPLNTDVTFSGGNSKYCNGASARNILDFNPNYWTITDGGFDCSSLDTNEFDTNSLKLYPNPVVSVLNIKTDSNLINQPYTIIDGLGRVVLNGKLNNVDTTINVDQLSKGIYYLKIAGNSATKFIKE